MHRRTKRKKYNTFCTWAGRDNKITTRAKLLDIIFMCKTYGFSADVIYRIVKDLSSKKFGE